MTLVFPSGTTLLEDTERERPLLLALKWAGLGVLVAFWVFVALVTPRVLAMRDGWYATSRLLFPAFMSILFGGTAWGHLLRSHSRITSEVLVFGVPFGVLRKSPILPWSDVERIEYQWSWKGLVLLPHPRGDWPTRLAVFKGDDRSMFKVVEGVAASHAIALVEVPGRRRLAPRPRWGPRGA